MTSPLCFVPLERHSARRPSVIEQLAEIPEEEIWLAKRTRARPGPTGSTCGTSWRWWASPAPTSCARPTTPTGPSSPGSATYAKSCAPRRRPFAAYPPWASSPVFITLYHLCTECPSSCSTVIRKPFGRSGFLVVGSMKGFFVSGSLYGQVSSPKAPTSIPCCWHARCRADFPSGLLSTCVCRTRPSSCSARNARAARSRACRRDRRSASSPASSRDHRRAAFPAAPPTRTPTAAVIASLNS